MQEKFHEKFQVILPSDYDTIRRLTDNDDVYGQFCLLYTSLIVVDEFLSYLTSRDERQIVLDLEFFRALGEMW